LTGGSGNKNADLEPGTATHHNHSFLWAPPVIRSAQIEPMELAVYAGKTPVNP
jgi:hypothetical protein